MSMKTQKLIKQWRTIQITESIYDLRFRISEPPTQSLYKELFAIYYIKMNDQVVEIILTALGISSSFCCFCYVVFNNHFCLFIDKMKKNIVEAEIV